VGADGTTTVGPATSSGLDATSGNPTGAPMGDAGSEGGCGCRVAATPRSSSFGHVALLGLFALGLVRRASRGVRRQTFFVSAAPRR
jgi:MYXO-CTERM domain-containing protein